MATKDAALKDASKTELAEAYSKLKSRTKNAQLQAKKEGELFVEDALTVASAGGISYLMGQRYANAEDTAKKDGKGGEELEAAIAEGGQVAGVDLDLMVGGAATLAGMMKLGGRQRNTVRRIGIGALAAYASRMGIDKGHDSVTEAE